MSGVYDFDQIYCPICQTETKHITGWESEEPNVIDVQCTVCYGERAVSGQTVMDGLYRRLIRPEHQAAYHKYVDQRYARLERALPALESLAAAVRTKR